MPNVAARIPATCCRATGKPDVCVPTAHLPSHWLCRPGSAGFMYRYTLQGGELLQRSLPGAPSASQLAAADPSTMLGASASVAQLQQQGLQQQQQQKPSTAQALTLGIAASASPAAPAQQPPKALNSAGPCSTASSPVRLAKLAGLSLPAFSPERPAGRASAELGMDNPAKRWVESLRPLDAHAPLLPQLVEGGQGEGPVPPSRPASPGRRRSSSPARVWQQEGGRQGSMPQSPARRRRASAPAITSPAAAAPARQLRNDSSSPVDGTPRRQLDLERSQQQCHDATPASGPSYTLAPPQRCESSPYTPALDQQQGRLVEPPQPHKGPLTAMVTKALSRLQQLEDLQHWQESVNSQLSGGSGGATDRDASDASSIKPTDARPDEPPALGARQLLPELQDAGGGAALPAARGLGIAVHPRRSAAEPSLSAIPEVSERSSSLPPGEQQALAEGGERWVPAASEEAAAGDDDEMQRLMELQEKLQTSMREVQKRIHAQATGSLGEQRGLGLEDSIPAAWPQHSWGDQGEETSGRGAPYEERPESRESGGSSQHYGQAMDDWLRHSNPLYNASRPGTAFSIRLHPLGAEESQLAAVAHALAAQGLEGMQHAEDVAAAVAAMRQQEEEEEIGAHRGSTLCAPLAAQSSPPPDAGASLSGLSLGAGGSMARSLHSLGSEFGIAGRDTEEEVGATTLHDFTQGGGPWPTMLLSPKQPSL
jgi:hypothetical protein